MIVPFCIVYFGCGAALAPWSYGWWMRRHGVRSVALVAAALTLFAPLSILYELARR